MSRIETQTGNVVTSATYSMSAYLLGYTGSLPGMVPTITFNSNTNVITLSSGTILVDGKFITFDSAGITGTLSFVIPTTVYLTINTTGASPTATLNTPLLPPQRGSLMAGYASIPIATINSDNSVTSMIGTLQPSSSGGTGGAQGAINKFRPIGSVIALGYATSDPNVLFPGTTWVRVNSGYQLLTSGNTISPNTYFGTARTSADNIQTSSVAITTSLMKPHDHGSWFNNHTHSISNHNHTATNHLHNLSTGAVTANSAFGKVSGSTNGGVSIAGLGGGGTVTRTTATSGTASVNTTSNGATGNVGTSTMTCQSSGTTATINHNHSLSESALVLSFWRRTA